MADKIIDSTEVSVTRQDLVLEMVQRELAASMKVKPLVTDLSEFALPGHRKISFPKLGSLEVQKLQEGQKGDAQALTATEDEIDLSEHASVQYIIKKQADVQSRLNWEAQMIQRATSAHTRGWDKDIIEAMAAGAAGGNDVTYDAGAIEGNILDVVEALDSANAPEEGRFVLFRPAQKKLLLQVANFVQADRYGSNMPLVSGELGQAYGLRFVMSNIATENFVDGVMLGFHREALGFAMQLQPEVAEQPAIEYGAGSKRVAIDCLYGYKVLQSGNLISKVS